VLSAAYARACNIALATVYCSEQRLPSDVAASLNGIRDSDLSAVDTDGLVSVLLLQDNSNSFVCYRGDHLPAAVLAWLTVVVFLVGFPVWSVVWSWQFSRALAAQMPNGHAKPDAATETSLPRKDPAASFFAATTYRPAVFFFRHAELAGFLALAAILVFWHLPQSAGSYGAKAAVTCLVLLGVAASLVWLRPHYRDERWRVPVRLGSLVLAGLMAVVNAVSGAASLHNGGSSESTALTALVWCMVVCSLLWLLLLIVSVGRSLIQGAKAEARLLQLRRALAQKPKKRIVARAAHAGGRGGQEGRSSMVYNDSRRKIGNHDAGLANSGRKYIGAEPDHPAIQEGRFAFASEQQQRRGVVIDSAAPAEVLKTLTSGFGKGAHSAARDDAPTGPAPLPLALRRELADAALAGEVELSAGGFAVRNPLGRHASDPPALDAGSKRPSLSLHPVRSELLPALRYASGGASAASNRRCSESSSQVQLRRGSVLGPTAVLGTPDDSLPPRSGDRMDSARSSTDTVQASPTPRGAPVARRLPSSFGLAMMYPAVEDDDRARTLASEPAARTVPATRSLRLSARPPSASLHCQRPSHTAVGFAGGGTRSARLAPLPASERSAMDNDGQPRDKLFDQW